MTMETETKTLSRHQILSATKLKAETVEVPEWGGSVIVREMTGTERDAWEAEIVAAGGLQAAGAMKNARAKLAVRTVVDDEGKRLFTDNDIEVVGRLSATALDSVFMVAARLSGLTAKDMEALEGN